MSFKYVESQPRNSKKQRRLNAKEKKKKEQDSRIDECSKLDEHRDRRMEQEKLNKLLKSKNLEIREVDADGDCLFKAIEHQLSLLNNQQKNIFTFDKLRARTSDYMLENPDEFIPFLLNDSGNLMTESEFKNYCHRVANTKQWGGNIELSALAKIIKRPIHIYQADSSQPIIIETCDQEISDRPVLLSFHKHLYCLGEHYNSLIPMPVQ